MEGMDFTQTAPVWNIALKLRHVIERCMDGCGWVDQSSYFP